MKRNPIDQFMKDPDNKAKLFVWITRTMIITTFRGVVRGSDVQGSSQIIHAFVPLGEMFGYATTLRSATQGRGVFSMEYDHYEAVSDATAAKVLEK